MYTQNSLPTDGTVGPFPIGFNYLDSATISVTRYDNSDLTLNPLELAFTFTGTPSVNTPSGTTITLSAIQALGKYIVIKKTISLTTPVIIWGEGAELTKKNLKSNTTNMMEMAQQTADIANSADTSAEATRLALASQVEYINSQAASATANALATSADLVLTNADAAQTSSDRVQTGVDVVASAAQAASAAASALAAQVAKIEWRGEYSALTAYASNDAVSSYGSSFICVAASTGNAPVLGGTAYWQDLAVKGTNGIGAGDLLAVNNLSDVASSTTARANLGLALGINVQAFSPFASKTNVPQTYTKAQRAAVVPLTDAANIASDFLLGNFFALTLAGNRTLDNPTNLAAGQSGCIFITQDATGTRTLAYGPYWDFIGGIAPVLSTAANAVDRLDYVVRSDTSIHTVLSKGWS